jgi:hypothetical protein
MNSLEQVVLITLMVSLLSSCNATWNDQFVDGKITKDTVVQTLPIGSPYQRVIDYIRANRIPKYDDKTLVGYSDKQSSQADLLDFDQALQTRLRYFVTIEGHRNLPSFPHYYHPVLCFCFDQEEHLIYVGEWGYP